MINVNSNATGSGSLIQQIQEKQNTLMERLASGKRVNQASDDAAAQQIIDRLTSETSAYRQSVTNAYDGISLSQIAEGGLSGINNDVNRIRELAVQAGNGLLSDADKKAIQSEITQLQENIGQTIEQTSVNGKSLLSGGEDLSFMVGSSGDQKIDVGTPDVRSGLSDLLSIDVTQAGGAEAALEAADTAVEFVGGARAELGATQNQFESAARNLTNIADNLAASQSRLQDTDYAQAASEKAAADVQSQASLTVQAQANAQRSQVLALLG